MFHQAQKRKKEKLDGNSSPSRPSPYDVLKNMPIFEVGAEADLERWYTTMCEIWERLPVHKFCTYVLLGSDVYCLGGHHFQYLSPPTGKSDVWKVNISNPTAAEWISAPPMITPRAFPNTLVLGGKLYVVSGLRFHSPTHRRAWDGEVYDPMTGSWQPLPEPPCYMGSLIITAALENPNRILAASYPYVLPEDEDSFDYSYANFCMYDVQNCSWKMLDPSPRKIPSLRPKALRENTVAVGDYLYRATQFGHLQAYNFHSDLWLTANLKDPKVPILEYDVRGRGPPGLLHLDNGRFCIIERKEEVLVSSPVCHFRCILVDVSPEPK
ncbi:hypothetical protein SLA2020_453200 [Shorea laevis]